MGESIIFSAYFTSRKDPQRGKYWKANDYEKIRPLYNSVKRLGLNMIIFHDSCNKYFIHKYETDKIKFSRFTVRGNITTERFVCYLNHLLNNVYNKIICLDCSDLELYKDPFPLIDDNILIGSEQGLIGDSPWLIDRFLKKYDRSYYENKVILNCGIIGGKYKPLVNLFIKFREEAGGINKNIDMPVFNKLIYDGIPFKTGFPIHTAFNKNEGAETGCYIRHK